MLLSNQQRKIIESFVNKNESLSDNKKEEIKKFLFQKENAPIVSATPIAEPIVSVTPENKEEVKTTEKVVETILIPPDINAVVQLILNDSEFATKIIERINIKGEKGDIGPAGNQGLPGEKGEKGDKGDSVSIEQLINTLFENEDFIFKLKQLIVSNSGSPWRLPGGGLGEGDVRKVAIEYTDFHHFTESYSMNNQDELLIYNSSNGLYEKINFNNFIQGISGISISANAGVNTINSLSGNVIISATGTNSIVQVGNTIIVSGTGGTGTVSGSYVRTIDGLSGDVLLSATGTNSLVQIGNTLIISGTGGSGTVSGSYVRTLNTLSGDINLSAGTNVNINKIGNTLVISSSGSSVSAGVDTINTFSGNITISAGPNIEIINNNKVITISAASGGVSQINGYFPVGW